jgi:tRNA-splicing ligase RtcB
MDNVKMWVSDETPIESQAYDQIKAMATLPILAGHIAIMPDVHWGKGATVGSVIPTRGAIIPAAVGSDEGCGMIAARLNITTNELPDNLGKMREAIEQAIPVGFNMHKNSRAVDNVLKLGTRQMFAPYLRELRERFNALTARHGFSRKDADHLDASAWKQVGTLGGGNHFIELQVDEAGGVWLMLHSGSRYVGKTLADKAISQALEDSERRGDKLPSKDLAWLAEGTPSFQEYVEALTWAQDYARMNRDVMMSLLWNAVNVFLPEDTQVEQVINCHHNYVEHMNVGGEMLWVTRKGAVSARDGEWGIIPGSMGTASYIVQGLGNPGSYYSCSHGAGRVMSRGKAKRTFTVEDLISQTAGVESRKDAGVLDEIPSAYKDIDAVMEAQKDLVIPRHRLKQLLCVKG